MISLLHGEKPGSRRSGFTIDGLRTYEVTYRVETADVDVEDWQVATLTQGLPKRGDVHGRDPWARCIAVDPRRRREDAKMWEVRVEWERLANQDPKNRKDIPPWLRPPRIRFDELLIEVSELRDLDGKLFLNSAKDPFIPAPNVPSSDAILTIERAEETYDEDKALGWANHTNKDEWAIGEQSRPYPPHALLLRMPTASDDWWSPVNETGIPEAVQYWNVVYRIWIKGGCFWPVPDLWTPLKVLDQGMRCRKMGLVQDPDDSDADPEEVWKTVFCVDDDGTQSTELQLLNEDGTQTTHEQLEDREGEELDPEEEPATGPRYKKFRVYDSIYFTELFPGF